MVIVCVSGGMWLSVLNVSIANIALPDIGEEFDADVASVGWIVTGFLVAQATLLSVAGRAGDLYGRRRVFVVGVLVLSLASLGSAAAQSLPQLIIARVLMGAGASAMAPTAFAYAAELFPTAERGRALGFMSGVLGLAPVTALTVGGLLVDAAGWRSVFLFTPVLAAIVLAGAAIILHESRPPDADRRFDLPGAALAAAGLFSLLVALSRGEAWGWSSPRTLLLGAGGLVLLAAFVARELRTEAPIIDLGFFRLRTFTAANAAGTLSSAALFGTLLLLPFYLTITIGMTPVELGLAITPIAASFMIVGPIAGRAMERVGSNRLALAGFVVAAAGVSWAAAIAPEARYELVLLGIVGLGVGLAMASSAVTVTAIEGVPRERLGVVTALTNVGRYTGGALGAAVLGAIMASSLPLGALDATAAADAATGFRVAMAVAGVFLAGAAIAAAWMPRVVGPAAPAPPGIPLTPPLSR